MRALVAVLAVVAAPLASAQDHEACPMHKQHQAVDQRHQHTTGIPSDVSEHHFLITKDGGAIRLDAREGDREARDQIRRHLQRIARAFSAGDFAMPTRIHARTPPGSEVMKERKASIQYSYRPTRDGGLVTISTADSQALEAVHEFLRFQIADHGTGDPAESQ